MKCDECKSGMRETGFERDGNLIRIKYTCKHCKNKQWGLWITQEDYTAATIPHQDIPHMDVPRSD